MLVNGNWKNTLYILLMNFPACFKTKLIGIFKFFLLHNIVGCIVCLTIIKGRFFDIWLFPRISCTYIPLPQLVEVRYTESKLNPLWKTCWLTEIVLCVKSNLVFCKVFQVRRVFRFAWNRDNVSKCSDMPIRGPFVQWASTIKIQLSFSSSTNRISS
jgi:hypothetical protein